MALLFIVASAPQVTVAAGSGEGGAITAVSPDTEESDSSQPGDSEDSSGETDGEAEQNATGPSPRLKPASRRVLAPGRTDFSFSGSFTPRSLPRLDRWRNPAEGWIDALANGGSSFGPRSAQSPAGGLAERRPEAVLLSAGENQSGEVDSDGSTGDYGGNSPRGERTASQAQSVRQQDPAVVQQGGGTIEDPQVTQSATGTQTTQTTTQQTRREQPGDGDDEQDAGFSRGQAFPVQSGPAPLKLPPLPGQPGAEEAIEEEETEEPEFEFNEDGTIDYDAVRDPKPQLTKEGKPTFPIEEGDMRMISDGGGRFDKQEEVYVLEDDVKLFWRDVIAGGDEVRVDQEEQTAQLEGDVFIRNSDDAIYGEKGYLNYQTGYFHIDDVTGNSGAPLVDGRMHFEAKNIEGTLDRYTLRRARLTTCEPWCNKDYELYAKRVNMKPGSKAVMHHVYLYLNGQKVFYVPVLAFPLRRDRYQRERIDSVIEQNYGYNETEGAFAKYAYTYDVDYHRLVDSPLLSVALLGFTQKLGNRYGLREDYFLPTQGAGMTRLKLRQNAGISEAPGSGEPTDFDIANAKVAQEVRLPLYFLTLAGKISGTRLREINTLSGATTDNDSAQWNFSQEGRGVQLNITGNMNRDIQGDPKPIRRDMSTTLDFTRQIRDGMTYSYNQNYTADKRSGQGPLDSSGSQRHNLSWNSPLGNLDASFRNTIDYDGDNNTGDAVSINDPKPRLNLSVANDLLPEQLGIQSASFSYEMLEEGKVTDLDRYAVTKAQSRWQDDMQVGDLSIENRLNFEQEMYNDGNARFILRPSVSANLNAGEYMRIGVDWNQTRTHGGASPQAGGVGSPSSNRLRPDIMLSNGQSWRLTMNTSYDYSDHDWSTLGMSLDLEPTESGKYGFRLSTSYDIEQARLSPLSLNFGYTPNHRRWSLRTNMSLNIHNSDNTSTFVRSGNLNYTRLYNDEWAFEVESSYNPGANNTLVDVVRAKKIGCCSTWSFSYQRSNREFQVAYTINAFPGRSIIAEENPEDGYQFFRPSFDDLLSQTPLSQAGLTDQF